MEGSYTRDPRMETSTGQEPASTAATFGPSHELVAAFVERMRALTDDERRRIAAARRQVSEGYHEGSLRAASELLAGRGDAYVRARFEVAAVHVSDGVDDETARLVALAVDDALLALVTADLLHPNHVRELYRSCRAVEPIEDVS